MVKPQLQSHDNGMWKFVIVVLLSTYTRVHSHHEAVRRNRIHLEEKSHYCVYVIGVFVCASLSDATSKGAATIIITKWSPITCSDSARLLVIGDRLNPALPFVWPSWIHNLLHILVGRGISSNTSRTINRKPGWQRFFSDHNLRLSSIHSSLLQEEEEYF